MPFLIEVKTKAGRWVSAAAELTKADADMAIEDAIDGGLPAHEVRVTEMDQARIAWRFVQDDANDVLHDYLRLNALAYDLKIKIRPR